MQVKADCALLLAVLVFLTGCARLDPMRRYQAFPGTPAGRTPTSGCSSITGATWSGPGSRKRAWRWETSSRRRATNTTGEADPRWCSRWRLEVTGKVTGMI